LQIESRTKGENLKEYLEFVGADAQRNTADSKKFWEVEVVGKKAFSRYGRIGSKGTKTVKEFPDKAAALAFAEKALAEKIKKGYSKKKTKQSQNDKVIPKEAKPLSLTFEYLIGFAFYMDDSGTNYKIPLTLQQKRESAASDFVIKAIEKGPKPKVEILTRGRVIEVVNATSWIWDDETNDLVWPWTVSGLIRTTHEISSKNAERVAKLVDENIDMFDVLEYSYQDDTIQARLKIGKYTFLSRSVWITSE
jgi:predicted DNA-binding WGR domain protein